jgi:hypothetical protein
MDNMAEIRDVLAHAATLRGELDTALAPGRALAEAIKAMQPPHLGIVTQLAAGVQREQRLFAELARPPRWFEGVAEQISQMQAVTDQITAPFRAVQEAIREQSSMFEAVATRLAALGVTQFTPPQLSHSALAWTVASSGLANRMQEIGLLAQRQSLAVRLFEAPHAYASFVHRTTELIEGANSPRVAALLRGSMSLAQDQLVGIADTLSGMLIVPDDSETPDSPRELDAPYVQQDELLTLRGCDDEADTDALAAMVPSAQVVALSRRVLELVTLCNEAAKTSPAGVEIFKPTTRLLAVFSDFPWVLPRNKTGFGDIVDCLYFIFYEGAGKDNLRFLDKHGGPLSEADCDLIWCIKHLRNKWSRHDADHGREKDIQKSWTELAAKFRWLGLAQHPSTPDHFQLIHRKLLELAVEFLERILAKTGLR